MSKFIVSCTTTHSRLTTLFYVIESIKRQTFKPHFIVLNISSEPYLLDKGIKEIPDWLKSDFIKINWVKNNGPYRKLLPVIERADGNDLIITADDDVLYGQNWLKFLIQLAIDNPKHIICSRARVIKKNVFGMWQNYANWTPITYSKKGMLILPNNGGGTVFRKNLLDMDFLLDPASQKISPTSDDLWLRMASMRKNVPVFVCPNIDQENLYINHSKSLMQLNVLKRSEVYMKRLINGIFGGVQNWLGINNSENDHAWERIVRYSNNTSYQKHLNVKFREK